jgi:gluconokinase
VTPPPVPSSGHVTQHVVVMGVSGCGKTTVAQGISERTGLPYGEADRFHPPENIAKMESGTPLTDEDRWPWLRELASWMAAQSAQGFSTVIACSALRRSYRDVLRNGPPGLQFVHLHGDPELIRTRMSSRSGHFMPASLLQSQLDTLEPLQDDEDGLVLDLALAPEELVDEAIRRLGLPLEDAGS